MFITLLQFWEVYEVVIFQASALGLFAMLAILSNMGRKWCVEGLCSGDFLFLEFLVQGAI